MEISVGYVVVSTAGTGVVAYLIGSLRANNQWRKKLSEEILPKYQTKKDCRDTHTKIDADLKDGSNTFSDMRMALSRICAHLNIDCPELLRVK